MIRPSLNRLRAFEAAGTSLNFRLAAERLNLTQGAVAQQVRALEEELAVPLFRRLPRGLALTDAGARYHEAVSRALAIIDEATNGLKPAPPRITLSLSPSLAVKWLVPRLPDFQDRHPKLEIATIATERLADFRSDGIDLAIRIGAPPFRGLESRFLSAINPVPVCAPSYLAEFGTIEKLSDLKGAQLLEDGHGPWRARIGLTGLYESCRILAFNHSGLAIEAAVAGQGIALVPDLLVQQDLEQGRLVALGDLLSEAPDRTTRDASIDRGYYLVFPRQAAANGAARDAVISWIAREFSDASV
jgi:LysR family glycine cleavage system transcriptional activator